jgi:hypothetical protein
MGAPFPGEVAPDAEQEGEQEGEKHIGYELTSFHGAANERQRGKCRLDQL